MKRNRVISISFLGIVLTISTFLFSVEVNANSAPRYWSGTTSIGTLAADQDCPITVEKELLTFDIQNFPDIYSLDSSESYSDKVTAEYTFHNPTEQAITATLVFPFGELPEYDIQQDVSRYNVMIDGNIIEAALRHTYIGDREAFSLEDSLPRLQDVKMQNDSYKVATPVTQYTFEIDGNLEEYPNVLVSIQLTDIDENVKLTGHDIGGMEIEDDQFTLECYPQENLLTFDVIGGQLDVVPEPIIYSDGTKEERLDLNIKLSSTTEPTLEQYLLLNYDSTLGISEIDWYNAAFTYLNTTAANEVLIEYEFLHEINERLMQWYVYDISIEPGQSIINSVTAPLYPDYEGSYSSPVYTYNYLLSPAAEWADFQNLTVVINTPYYMINSSLDELEQTENGFTKHFNQLPDKEFSFQLCEEENPTSTSNVGLIVKFLIFIVIAAILIIVLVIIILVKIVKSIRQLR